MGADAPRRSASKPHEVSHLEKHASRHARTDQDAHIAEVATLQQVVRADVTVQVHPYWLSLLYQNKQQTDSIMHGRSEHVDYAVHHVP